MQRRVPAAPSTPSKYHAAMQHGPGHDHIVQHLRRRWGHNDAMQGAERGLETRAEHLDAITKGELCQVDEGGCSDVLDSRRRVVFRANTTYEQGE